MVIIVPADVLAPGGAKPSAGTMLTANVDIFHKFSAVYDIKFIFINETEISFKMDIRSLKISGHFWGYQCEAPTKMATCGRWHFETYVFKQCRADSRFALSQWEMALLCNDVSHWLGANLESALQCLYFSLNLTKYNCFRSRWHKSPMTHTIL